MRLSDNSRRKGDRSLRSALRICLNKSSPVSMVRSVSCGMLSSFPMIPTTMYLQFTFHSIWLLLVCDRPASKESGPTPSGRPMAGTLAVRSNSIDAKRVPTLIRISLCLRFLAQNASSSSVWQEDPVNPRFIRFGRAVGGGGWRLIVSGCAG
jgi:hypothetical protein